MGRPTKALADRWVSINVYMPPDRPNAYAAASDLARVEGLPNAENRSQWMRGACDMRMEAESRDRARLARKAVGP
jgi:hypothetical protein